MRNRFLKSLLVCSWLAGFPYRVSGAEAGPSIKQELVVLRAQDGGVAKGAVYVDANRRPKTAVVMMHPESDTTTDVRLKPLAAAGFLAFAIAGRYTGRDIHQIQEELLLDIAAGLRYLKRDHQIEKVVLLGHSGGGPLMGFYQSQAEKSSPHRVKSTPAGDPPNLNEYELPKADGLILSSSHWGRGWVVMFRLDPSVADEDDPVAAEPNLDLYNPANGFRMPPESSSYSVEFLKRYREAQKARMDRLVAKARAMVEEKKRYRKLMENVDFAKLSLYDQLKIARRGVSERYMVIYRRTARPEFVDLSQDPSDRIIGGDLLTGRPDLANYSKYWHPSPITPEAFLSSESTASNAFLIQNVQQITVPTLVIYGTADPVVFLEKTREIYKNVKSADKKLVLIEGADHGYQPSGPKSAAGNQRQQMLDALMGWLRERYP